jgi:hypothetical protein
MPTETNLAELGAMVGDEGGGGDNSERVGERIYGTGEEIL